MGWVLSTLLFLGWLTYFIRSIHRIHIYQGKTMFSESYFIRTRFWKKIFEYWLNSTGDGEEARYWPPVTNRQPFYGDYRNACLYIPRYTDRNHEIKKKKWFHSHRHIVYSSVRVAFKLNKIVVVGPSFPHYYDDFGHFVHKYA